MISAEDELFLKHRSNLLGRIVSIAVLAGMYFSPVSAVGMILTSTVVGEITESGHTYFARRAMVRRKLKAGTS